MSNDATLYEDHFEITTLLDSTYDRVARVIGTSRSSSNTSGDTSLTLDINSELYPIQTGETIQMLIATTLNLDGTKDTTGQWRERRGEETLASAFDYVCYGKVYKHFDPGEGGNIKVYISFGGLLLLLDGPYKKLSPLRQDYVYMLLKK
ncbi:DNA-directed RNA polymerases I, II, and III subunit RPABC3 [Saxophila tyrrhenica]|uniref:DNA-directed RNA polymerases I, II, and III subunit RPABC3 n=1 Tax=Saxophila tyrrhenica TaxID=1690608 RepID=A0AAV9P313_9PEZI|nr:DNA-directed RNA polymerases I, II, and III subunit RPABC3 [Saxophila tyrrhenica]